MAIVNLVATPVSPKPNDIPETGTGVGGVGTRHFFREELRDKHSNLPVGQHSGMCTLVREPSSPSESGFWLCHAGWILENVGPGAGKTGTLVAGGLLNFSAGPPFMVAIFGGTGDFDTVRGEVAAAPIPGTDDWDYSLALVP